MILLAGLYGGTAGAVGTLLSTLAPRMPTGPLIVLAATVIFLLSLLFAPGRGLVARGLRLAAVRVAARSSAADADRPLMRS
jgi:manganese/zinc/iron transport system permease protein